VTTLAYDAAGFLRSVLDPAQHTSLFAYDLAGRGASQKPLDAAHAACNFARVPADSQPATGRLALVRAIPRKVSWLDLGVLGFIALCAYGVARLSGEWRAPLHEAVAIDLSLCSLPLYTFFSLCRGLAALALSFFFMLVYGYVAARVRLADRVSCRCSTSSSRSRCWASCPGWCWPRSSPTRTRASGWP